MSTLSQFAGGGIKSIQRGTSSAASVTISAVNTAKTELRLLGNSNAFQYITLTNSTTIDRAGGSGTWSWELTERF
jgi:hypothetical protein